VDLAVANSSLNSVTILYGHGDESFGVSAAVGAASTPPSSAPAAPSVGGDASANLVPLRVESTFAPGTRLRIAEREGGIDERRSGTVTKAGADTVVLRLDSTGESIPIFLPRVASIEASQGFKHHMGAGAGYGLLAGACTGVLVAVLAKPPEGYHYGSDNVSTGFVALVSGVAGGVIGLVVGAGIGASVKTEIWAPVPSALWHVSTRGTTTGDLVLALSVKL
jgi:hypothetical protein